MNKAQQLLKLSKNFIKQAFFPHLIKRYTLQVFAEDNLIQESEKFDIKDEELFNQFESFMSAYQELLESLEIDPGNLDAEAMDEPAQLIDVLNTRYSRIMNNSYLNLDVQEGYDEDFNPGELTKFIQKVVTDAENKLKNIAGEDIDIGELRAAQFAQEFNQLQERHEEGKKEEWSAKKVQQALEARKKYFNDLMFIKKVGKSHPDYARYERYIESRRNAYANIIKDPVRKEQYRSQAKERQSKFRKKLDVRKDQIIQLMKQTSDPKKLELLQQELNYIELEHNKRKNKLVDIANKLREKKNTQTLDAHIIHLTQKLATQKNEAAKTLKRKMNNDPFFAPYKQAISIAEAAVKTDPSPGNMAALEAAKKADVSAVKNHPILIKITEDLTKLYDFRDKVKQLNELKWFDTEVPEDGKSTVQDLIKQGTSLCEQYNKNYRSPCASINDIINIIVSKLNGQI